MQKTELFVINTLARILESGLNLVHTYSRNKSDKEDCLFFIPIFNS